MNKNYLQIVSGIFPFNRSTYTHGHEGHDRSSRRCDHAHHSRGPGQVACDPCPHARSLAAGSITAAYYECSWELAELGQAAPPHDFQVMRADGAVLQPGA